MERGESRRGGRRVASAALCAALALLCAGGGVAGPQAARAARVAAADSDVGCESSATPEPPATPRLVRYVDDDAGCKGQQPCYASIQAAADAAASGETLSVAPGTYDEAVVVVDKALVFQGPGIGDPDQPRPEREAIWGGGPDGLPGVALTVEARTTDQGGPRVTGFRFVSASIGVLLVGRRLGDPVPLPARLPASAKDVALAGARIDHNVFDLDAGSSGTGGAAGGEPERGALVAYWNERPVFEHNVVVGGVAGAVVIGGSGARLRDNRISQTDGPGIRLRAHGDDMEVCRNALRKPGGRGIEVRALGGAGLAGRATGLRIIDNSITEAGAEGIDIAAERGGEIRRVDLRQNAVSGAGLGAARPGMPEGAPFGAIALRGGSGVLADVRIEGGSIQGMRRPAGANAPAGAGIYAEGVATTCDISAVSVADSEGPGVQLVDLDNVWLHRSTIQGNAEGVRIVESEAIVPGAPSAIRLGDFATEGNVLAGNDGPALVLVNARGGPARTRDVDASFNDWGTAYAPDIEDAVQHNPDDPRLGDVTYLPALGTPSAVVLAANPPRLVADGESESVLTATARDARDRPVADGTLIRFTAEGGVLARPGALVEAEDEGGSLPVARSTEWEIADSGVFGPPNGDAFLRSAVPGAVLTWTFDAPALLVRYGQTLLGAGSFSLRVDGRDVGPISTLGPGRVWVERVVARGLGAGPHTVELTVRTGEINVDLFAAGTTSLRGQAEARLRSPAEIGSGRVRVAAHGADAVPESAMDVPFTAGPPHSLVLSTGVTSLAVGGATTVTAEVRDALGRPVPDDTEVLFSADKGTISPARALTQNGHALADYAGDTELGVATLRAESGSASATRAITLVAGPPAAVTIAADQRTLTANSTSATDLVITVRDAFRNPVQDGTFVAVLSNLGTLEGMEIRTTNGVARTRLRTGNVAGDARVKATAGEVGGTASAELSITFIAPDIRLVKQAEPRTVVVPGEWVTFTLRVDNVGSGSVYALDIDDPLPGGLITPILRPPVFVPPGPEIDSLGEGTRYRFQVDQLRPGQTGIITISAKVDTSLLWVSGSEIVNRATAGSAKAAERTPDDNLSSAKIMIEPSAVFTVTVRGPDRLLVAGGSGTIRARVTDRFGNPAVDGTRVFFTSDLGTTLLNESMPTDNGWAETELTAGTRAGVATVRAVSDNRGGLAYVRITPDVPAELRLVNAKPSLRIRHTMVITATVTDSYGNGVPDRLVSFESSKGGLSDTAVRTGPTGIATTTLRSGVRVGIAEVRATSGPLVQSLAIPITAGEVAGIELALDPPVAVVGGQVGVDAWLTDEFGNPTPGESVEFQTDIGVLRNWLVRTDAEGHALTSIDARQPGSGRVRASASGFTSMQPLTVGPAKAYLPATWKNVRLVGR